MANTKKKLTFSTAKGIAMYPWLNKADFQFDSNGQFKVNLKLDKADAADLIKAVQEAANNEFGTKEAQNVRLPFKTDEDTGQLIIVTKSKFRPKIMDSQGNLISENNVPPIYGGSTLKLAGTIYPYVAGGNKGVSLQLAGVQIVELSQGETSSVSFAAEEGGFVAANDNLSAANDNQPAAEGDGGQAYNF
jgi:hypothetical protein